MLKLPQKKQAGKDANIFDSQNVATNDEILEDKCNTPTLHTKNLVAISSHKRF